MGGKGVTYISVPHQPTVRTILPASKSPHSTLPTLPLMIHSPETFHPDQTDQFSRIHRIRLFDISYELVERGDLVNVGFGI
jgi:hypothetical protein